MKQLASFKKQFVVKVEDIDELNHVNNIIYLKWVQEIAGEHWISLAPTSITENHKWVVVNHNISYKKALTAGESVTVETQVADDVRGATWGRNVWIFNGSHELAAEANTKWCLVDAITFRPVRISDDIISIFISDE